MYTIKKIPKNFMFVIVISAIVIVLLLVADSAASAAAKKTGASLDAGNSTMCAEFLSQYGWEISAAPEEIQEITLPESFDKSYRLYNELQLSQGFDLTEYCGKTVTRESYIIANYPDGIENVRANLLIYDGKIIGGDICSVALDGFMHGFSL